MSNNRREPEIRFPGFDGEWEQRKLNEIAEKVTEKNKNNLYNEPFTNSAELGIVSQKDFFDQEVVNEDNLDGYYVVKNDDFVYNPRMSVTAPVGPINRNKLNRNGVMSPLYTVFRTHDINNTYLEQYFKTTNWHIFMKMNGDSGARFDRFSIVSRLFMNMPVPYPSIEEQVKIGCYLESFDNFITLHQRKCEEAKEFKKSMLQKMFPKRGESVPEIRFPGFTGEWERRKLGDVLEERNVLQVQTEEYPLVSFTVENGVTPKTDRYNREQLVVGDTKAKKYKVTELNDIVYNPANLKFGAIARNKFGKAVFSPIYITFAVNLDKVLPEFIERTVTRKEFIDEALRYQQGTVYERKSVNSESLLSMEITIPELREQRIIGDMFDYLDDFISLTESKIAEIKKYKKGLLQKMFV